MIRILTYTVCLLCFTSAWAGEKEIQETQDVQEQPRHAPPPLPPFRLQLTSEEIEIKDLKDYFDQVTVITFNDETKRLYGNGEERPKFCEPLSRALAHVLAQKPRAIGIDVRYTGVDPEKRSCLMDVMRQSGVPFVLIHLDRKMAVRERLFDRNRVSIAVPVGFSHKTGTIYPDVQLHVGDGLRPHPLQRYGRFITPVSYEQQTQFSFEVLRVGSVENRLNLGVLQYVRFNNYAESNITKVTLQSLITPEPNNHDFEGKYVLVAVDIDGIDDFPKANNDSFNGGFMHAHAIAAGLYRQDHPSEAEVLIIK